jgi:hypothetical protein
MQIYYKIIYFTILLIILWFIIGSWHSYVKYSLQIKLYDDALKLSKLLEKPLLVIGNPIESSTNHMFGSYGCGNICIDINGCNCNNNTIVIKNKLEDELHKFDDNSVIIFESETLEYVDDDKIDYVISEMYRISGKNIFSVHQLKPKSFLTLLKTSGYSLFNNLINKQVYTHKRLFSKYPPNNDYIY